MKQIIYKNNKIYGAVTLKDLSAPEKQNMALHVCQDPEKVMMNRIQLARELELPLERWALPWQKHTCSSYRITQKDLGRGAFEKETSIMNVDAVYTTEPDVLLGVFTADCCGILIMDETVPSLCAIHSGWKGTTLEITYQTVQKMMQEGLLHPESAQVFFSPSILFDSLEVGMEVVEQMLKISSIDPAPYIRYMPGKKAYIDNQGLNAAMLAACGIPEENIHLSSMDTKKEPQDCFSFRNDKKTGEHFTYGFIKGGKTD